MKKLFLILALALPMVATAQQKSAEDVKKGVEKALVATQDAKKASKAATWVALAKAYVAAYEQPVANLLVNSAKPEVQLFLKGQTVLRTETRQGAEATYSVDVYPDKDLYYNSNEALELWIITKPVVENALAKAQEALVKATELDPKWSSNKEYTDLAEKIHNKLYSDALYCYLSGNAKDASFLFENAANARQSAPLNTTDSLSIYYAAMMAGISGQAERALGLYQKCVDIEYYSEGNVFSNLANIQQQVGDTTASKATLEKGFVAFPESQSILVGLINLYISTNDDPNKLFDLLHTAQANEPGNASLYYVEGDVNKKLGNKEKAIELFNKATEVDPSYVFGVLNIGILHYDEAVNIQEKANQEYDDAKYMALVEELNAELEAAIEPFEKSFNMTSDKEIKMAIAEYLKNIFFRFRDKGETYQAAYNTYNSFVKGE